MNEMSDIKDDIRKEQFQNVSKKIPEKGIYLTVHEEYPAYNLKHYNIMWNGRHYARLPKGKVMCEGEKLSQ